MNKRKVYILQNDRVNMTKETGKQETIEEMQGIVAQRKFATLDAFVKGQNNFYAHFLAGNAFGDIRRRRAHFQRFQMMYPKLEEEVTREVCKANTMNKEPSNELLYKAYNLMSQLVFEGDKGVQRYTYKDHYLTR